MCKHTLTFLFVLKVKNIKRDVKLNSKKLLRDVYEIYRICKRQKMEIINLYMIYDTIKFNNITLNNKIDLSRFGIIL